MANPTAILSAENTLYQFYAITKISNPVTVGSCKTANLHKLVADDGKVTAEVIADDTTNAAA